MLLVDPRVERLERMAALLRQGDFKVVALTRYEASLPLVGVFQPEVALFAAIAPEFVGCTVARRLRQLAKRTLPLFYLIDAPDPQLREHCLNAGRGTDVFAHPLDPRELTAKIFAQVGLIRAVRRVSGAMGDAQDSSLRDSSTGVSSRKLLLAVVAQDLRRTERYGGSFSILAAKVRGHAALTRKCGGEVAERLVGSVAAILTQTVREADVVARVSEDTFALLLTGASSEQVDTAKARLASRFEQARYQVDGEWLKTSLTLGSASFPDVVVPASQMLELALEDVRRAVHGVGGVGTVFGRDGDGTNRNSRGG